MDLSLSSYGIVHNRNETWWGEYIATMGKIGLYPYYDRKSAHPGTSHNGGIPQLGNLTAHLAQVEVDIRTRIPDEHFRGLALIDWEEWKPVWGRNWESREIYQKASIELVERQHPGWPRHKMVDEAVREFEHSARLWMNATIEHAKSLRPKAFWGYYEFPNCFNHKGHNGYHCSTVTVNRNNQIQWLFNASTALYPSIYVRHPDENDTQQVHYDLLEALRVDSVRDIAAPVYPYALYKYGKSNVFMEHRDLVATVGQSADLGTAGIVFWADGRGDRSRELCLELKHYIKTTLGPYVLSVSRSAQECSKKHCSGNGRCFIPTDYYLSVQKESGMTGFLGLNWEASAVHFKCQCYTGWSGNSCGTKSYSLSDSVV